MTYSRFLELFPDNDACRLHLKERHFPDGTECPKCGKASKFHRVTGRSAYSCQFCGHHVYPTAGTIFHKSTVGLQLWFYAIYLMSSTRCGVSAKQLEREIGVTYKTAHRMFKQIRMLLSDEDEGPLGGEPPALVHADVLADAQPRRAGAASRFLALLEVARDRSRMKPASVWPGSCLATTSLSGGEGDVLTGRLRTGLMSQS